MSTVVIMRLTTPYKISPGRRTSRVTVFTSLSSRGDFMLHSMRIRHVDDPWIYRREERSPGVKTSR